jgi:Trypsin-co-occurring domain 2
MPDSDRGQQLVGGVSLSAAIGALREELMYAVWAGQFPYQLNGEQRTLRFKPAPIEVTLQVAVTSKGTAKAGVKWWLIEAGADLSREKVATQTVKLTLEPAMFDENGQQVELLIDTADNEDSAASSGAGGEELLDAAD